MNIVVYAQSDSPPYQRLNHAIAGIDLHRNNEVYDKVNLFCQRLRTVSNHPDVIIIMPGCQEELDALIDQRELFENTRTIVILPEREGTCLSKCHKFHPCFITFRDDDFGEVAAILQHLSMNHTPGRPTMHTWQQPV